MSSSVKPGRCRSVEQGAAAAQAAAGARRLLPQPSSSKMSERHRQLDGVDLGGGGARDLALAFAFGFRFQRHARGRAVAAIRIGERRTARGPGPRPAHRSFSSGRKKIPRRSLSGKSGNPFCMAGRDSSTAPRARRARLRCIKQCRTLVYPIGNI
jgi:hypothetical protein